MNLWLVSTAEQTVVDGAKSTRFINIANEALRRGHRVTYFASTFKHNTKVQRYEQDTVVEVQERYRLIFLRSLAYRRNVSPTRMYSHYAFAKYLVAHFEQMDERPDLVYLGYPPVSLGYEVTAWCQREQIPCIVDIIDPWPDMFLRKFSALPAPIGRLLLAPMFGRARKTFSQATGIAAISQEYIDWARSYAPGIRHAACFYPAVDYAQMREEIRQHRGTAPRPARPLRVTYAGSLGWSYDLTTILEAAALLERERGDAVHFEIAGAGEQASAIQQYADQHANLTFHGRLSKDALMRVYAACHLGTTQHIKGASQSVTYKLFDLLACGLPILNSLESEMQHLIVDNEVGLHNDPGDARQLADNICRFLDEPDLLDRFAANAHRLTAAQGDSAVVYGRLLDYVERLALGTAKDSVAG